MTSALTPGGIVEIDFGLPMGSEAGMVRPAIVVTAARILGGEPNVVQVVPLTRTLRVSSTEVRITPDVDNGLGAPSAAQCQHVRSLARARVGRRLGNVGPSVLADVREVIALLLDL